LDQRKTFCIFGNDRANNLNSRLQTFQKVVSIILIRGYKPRIATSKINLGWVFLVRIENMNCSGHGKLKTTGRLSNVRLGINSENVRHAFQNQLAHTIIKPQAQFKVLGWGFKFHGGIYSGNPLIHW
jgi:hypothetical protein